jgi:hypothetical protein
MIDSGRYRSMFSPAERNMLSNASRLPLAPSGSPEVPQR